MRITRTVAAAAAAAALAVAGLGATAVAAPAVLAAAGSDTTEGPLQAVRDALAGLVGDGTLTQEQADTVASTLDEAGVLGHGHGGPGRHWGPGGRLLDLDVAAETVGLTVSELRTQLAKDGATLAGVAEEQGVQTSTLVTALVAAATERLEAAVTDGRLTREQADERIAELPEVMGAVVERELRVGHRHYGHGPRGGDDSATPTPTPDATGSRADA